jgi:hypothetical protein
MNAYMEPPADCTKLLFMGLRPWNDTILDCKITANPNCAAVARAAILVHKSAPRGEKKTEDSVCVSKQTSDRKFASKKKARVWSFRELGFGGSLHSHSLESSVLEPLFRNLEILRIMFQSMWKVKSQLHNANSTLIII